MPMSITSRPVSRMPFFKASIMAEPETRPSRATTIVVSPLVAASEPSALPISCTVSGVRVFPTMPRIS